MYVICRLCAEEETTRLLVLADGTCCTTLLQWSPVLRNAVFLFCNALQLTPWRHILAKGCLSLAAISSTSQSSATRHHPSIRRWK
jgi:hypothetical protein